MGERRFVIREFPSGGTEYNNTITEDELKRRIEWVIQWLNANSNLVFSQSAWDIVRSVVVEGLHGEGENQHDLPGCEEEAGPNWKGEGEKPDQPNKPPVPVPTREKWEAWVRNLPVVMLEKDRISINADTWKKWLLSMPIVPSAE